MKTKKEHTLKDELKLIFGGVMLAIIFIAITYFVMNWLK